MGIWGPGIFDDDTTCDVRGHYRRALRAGVPGSQATDQILHAYAPGADPFDAPVWLGLAATQTQLGRLEERVKTKALEVIDSGADPVEPLTERELEVLKLLAAGAPNRAIAGQLVVTLDTVKRHLSNLFSKLGVANRTQAVARARELGLLP